MTAGTPAGPVIRNFSGEVRFRPTYCYRPRSEAEVLGILDRHRGGTVRVIGARHSWNDGLVSEDAIIDLGGLDRVETSTLEDGTVVATVGGGCRLEDLLPVLRRQAGVTLPSMGLITEQTVAGAISTGTHGSGRHSLSHYMEEVRVAAYDRTSGRATIHHLSEGDDLRAARCAVGCMGVVLSVRFRCPPRYLIAESLRRVAGIDEALRREAEFPLQQFYLIPHLWDWYSQERRTADGPDARPSRLALLYRLYWLVVLDVGFHVLLKSLLALPSSGPLRFFYRLLFPLFVLRTRPIVDWSERQLVMEHELFRHMEIELFVPRRQVREAAAFVEEVLKFLAGTGPVSETLRGRLESEGLLQPLLQQAGRYTHHYPICIRKVLPDDTLLSMASDRDQPWYAISLITYQEPRAPFTAMADFLTRSMTALFGARPHWGKYCPVGPGMADHLYPEATTFRSCCRRVDPDGTFRNAFVTSALGFSTEDHASEGGGES